MMGGRVDSQRNAGAGARLLSTGRVATPDVSPASAACEDPTAHERTQIRSGPSQSKLPDSVRKGLLLSLLISLCSHVIGSILNATMQRGCEGHARSPPHTTTGQGGRGATIRGTQHARVLPPLVPVTYKVGIAPRGLACHVVRLWKRTPETSRDIGCERTQRSVDMINLAVYVGTSFLYYFWVTFLFMKTLQKSSARAV